MNKKKIMKAAIITIRDNSPNFGNMLQNYATIFLMEKLSIYSESIIFDYKKKTVIKEHLKRIFHFSTRYLLCNYPDYWRLEAVRKEAFNRFGAKYCHDKFVSKKMIKDLDYDFYVIGSDQVWNPTWYSTYPLRVEMFLLSFAKPEQRICMAPSFGISELPDEWKDLFKRELRQFPHLSVREPSGAKIIEELTRRKADVVIDPTLMLDKKEWRKIAQMPKKVNCQIDYILTYFLGGKNQEQEELLKKIANVYNLEIYNLWEQDDENLYKVDPANFIYLIDHAKMVMTDSFHACVFSFLFDKPFLVFERGGFEKNMFSRIESLLKMFSLQRKYYNSGIPNNLFECDYTYGKSILEAERKKALVLLKKSMGLV